MMELFILDLGKTLHFGIFQILKPAFSLGKAIFNLEEFGD